MDTHCAHTGKWQWWLATLVVGMIFGPQVVWAQATRPAEDHTAPTPPNATQPAAAPSPLPADKATARELTSASQPTATQPAKKKTPFSFLNRDRHSSGMVARMLAYCGVILVVGLIALVVFKRYGGKLKLKAGKQILLVESTALGPNQYVHLLEINGRRVLVGACKESLTMLGDLGKAAEKTPGGDFADELARVQSDQDNDDGGGQA